MTIDERLEVLAQTVELLVGMQKDTNTHLSKLDEAIAQLKESQIKTEQMVRSMGRYAMLIAREHDLRISLLEFPKETT
jgi:ribosome-interacting GTPase 1